MTPRVKLNAAETAAVKDSPLLNSERHDACSIPGPNGPREQWPSHVKTIWPSFKKALLLRQL
eukprot:5419122-Amphidinium_carterae.1